MTSVTNSLIAGAVAGTLVDSAFFPLDTLKTRLQSKGGFFKSDGFKGLYRGFSSAVAGSAPSAAFFFVTYDSSKKFFKQYDISPHTCHMLSASLGEITACIIRVPTEVVKQRLQTGRYKGLSQALKYIKETNGNLGFYRGFFTTVFREIPFTCIQFPLYEHLKKQISIYKSSDVVPWEAAICGSIAGGIAAAATTPLDVLKTRTMLSDHTSGNSIKGIAYQFNKIVKQEGVIKLFSGVGPRVIWISAGGFLFLGAYEKTISILN